MIWKSLQQKTKHYSLLLTMVLFMPIQKFNQPIPPGVKVEIVSQSEIDKYTPGQAGCWLERGNRILLADWLNKSNLEIVLSHELEHNYYRSKIPWSREWSIKKQEEMANKTMKR